MYREITKEDKLTHLTSLDSKAGQFPRNWKEKGDREQVTLRGVKDICLEATS